MKSLVFLACLLVSIIFISFKDLENEAPLKLPKYIKERFSFVPGGIVRFNDYLDSARLNSFYISKFEVSNLEYRTFLETLANSGEIEKYSIAEIDSLNWRHDLTYSDPFVKYYHSHPAYDNFPVVNISYEGAKLYCEWLTRGLNEEYSNDEFVYEVRLPSKPEWVKAARAGSHHNIYSNSRYVRSSEGKFLYNFKNIGPERIHFDTVTKTYVVVPFESEDDLIPEREYIEEKELARVSYITSPVKSYWPNDYDLYNMSGNVAEMISPKGLALGGSWNSPGYDIRIESIFIYKEPSPTVGFRPVLTVRKKEAE